MNPKLRSHLEWIEHRQPVALFPVDGSGPSLQDVRRLLKSGDVEPAGREPGHGVMGMETYRLSAQGEERLGAAQLDVGRDAVEHLRTGYPAALEAVTPNAAVSLRNFINNRIEFVLEKRRARERKNDTMSLSPPEEQ